MRLWERIHNLCHRKLKLEPEDVDSAVQRVLADRLEEMLETMGPELMSRFLDLGDTPTGDRESRDITREVRTGGRD